MTTRVGIAISARPSAVAAAIAISSELVITVSPSASEAADKTASKTAFRSTLASLMCAPSHSGPVVWPRSHLSKAGPRSAIRTGAAMAARAMRTTAALRRERGMADLV